VLADPASHPVLDGSGMLQPGASAGVLRRAGDVFDMKMHAAGIGDYVMRNRVVEFELNRSIGWEPTPWDEAAVVASGLPPGTSQGYTWTFRLVPEGPGVTLVTETFDCADASADIRQAVHDGADWIGSMTATLERLDRMCRLA
jgi:hypothetical protein